jgi:hypothetical protein
MSAARAMHLGILGAEGPPRAHRRSLRTTRRAPDTHEAGVDIIPPFGRQQHVAATPVTMDGMVMLTRAARRGTKHAFLLGIAVRFVPGV